MLTVKGIIKLDDTGLRVILNEDFSRYYLWLIHKAYYNTIKLDRPRHGSHLSIITRALHNSCFNVEYLKQYHNQWVTLEYDPEDIRIGGRNFTNFWFPIKFPLGDLIKSQLNIVEIGFLGYHITVANNKSSVNYKCFR